MSEDYILPDFVDTNGAWEEVLDRLYSVFTSIFKQQPRRKVLGKSLIFDERTIDSDLEEGFWHVITKGKGEDRILDTERARRLSWISDMLDGVAEGLSRWKYQEGDGTNKLYYWLEDERYVLILAERKSVISLVTAFYVDQPWLESDLKKRRAKGQAF